MLDSKYFSSPTQIFFYCYNQIIDQMLEDKQFPHPVLMSCRWYLGVIHKLIFELGLVYTLWSNHSITLNMPGIYSRWLDLQIVCTLFSKFGWVRILRLIANRHGVIERKLLLQKWIATKVSKSNEHFGRMRTKCFRSWIMNYSKVLSNLIKRYGSHWICALSL